MKLQIPEIAYEGLEILSTISDEEAGRFLKFFAESKPDISWESLKERASDFQGNDKEKIEKVIDTIKGLYEYRNKYRVTTDELVSDVVESAKEDENTKGKIEPEKLTRLLKQALSFNTTLGITAKATEVIQEQQNVFVDGRIITDIRPVFCDELNEGIPASAIIHNFRIDYITNFEFRRFVVALNSKNLADLEKAISRAKEKEKVLRVVCAKTDMLCLEEEK